jgi:septal ring factor EnvC (AmiA/AmiB activator)
MENIIIENKNIIEEKNKKIKQLETEIDEIRMVIKGEKDYNQTLKEQLKKYELTIETLQKINEEFLIKVANLRNNIEILTKK